MLLMFPPTTLLTTSHCMEYFPRYAKCWKWKSRAPMIRNPNEAKFQTLEPPVSKDLEVPVVEPVNGQSCWRAGGGPGTASVPRPCAEDTMPPGGSPNRADPGGARTLCIPPVTWCRVLQMGLWTRRFGIFTLQELLRSKIRLTSQGARASPVAMGRVSLPPHTVYVSVLDPRAGP